MRAMILESLCEVKPPQAPLRLVRHSDPVPAPGEILVRVTRCGVCHTELDEIEGRTPPAQLPVIPGHQVVGVVTESSGLPLEDLQPAPGLHPGQRVGVAWIASACGECPYCLSGQENLCPSFQATGRDVDGGYAEYVIADLKNYLFEIDGPTAQVLRPAPILCTPSRTLSPTRRPPRCCARARWDTAPSSCPTCRMASRSA